VEPSGELNVGLCYNDNTQRITVSIVEARNLKTASLDNTSPGVTTNIQQQQHTGLHLELQKGHSAVCPQYLAYWNHERN